MAPSSREKVLILGSGPNRIGQGIEFDYCCVHACFALADAGYETIMVNCNPETVSTDYDTSDRLYFEPLSIEGVRNVIDAERRPRAAGGGSVKGVIVSLGGQTPLKLANVLPRELILGTSPDSHRPGRGPRPLERAVRPARDPPARGRHRHRPRPGARDHRPHRLPGAGPPELRARRSGHGDRLRRRRPRATRWRRWPVCPASAARAGSPPSGRCWSTGSSRTPPRSTSTPSATTPARWSSAAIMEHVEEAGVHSGDSACMIPPVGSVGRHDRGARGLDAAHRRGARRPRPDQRAVRGQARRRQPRRRPRCSSSRRTRGRRGPCRSWPRPPACPW